MILIFEVCMIDCPKSWSGLLALAAARVLRIQDVAALLAFVTAAERLFSEDSGIVWAAEPEKDFFINFIETAIRAHILEVTAAVKDHAERMETTVEEATDFLATEFRAEAIWLARAGAPIFEPLRWILRRTPRPQAAFAWTQIRNILADHELPWSVDLLVSRARQVITQGGTTFWWRGQGGSEASAAEQERMRTTWTSRARAKLSCLNFGSSSASYCVGTWGNWKEMCLACRMEESVYERDPCLAKFERGYGTTSCYGPNDERGNKCRSCAGRVDKRKLPEGVAPSATGGSSVRSALQLEKCPGCGRTVKSCRAARRENKAPFGKLEICQAC